jgi:signal transduction histidine kinase
MPSDATDATAHVRWRPGRSDIALAALVTVVQVGFTILAGAHQNPERDFDALAVILLASGPVALAWQRRFPLGVYAVVFTSALAYWVSGYPQGPVFFALVIAFVTVVLAGYRFFAWGSIVLGYVSFQWLGVLVGTRDEPSVVGALGLGAWLLVLATTAEIVRIRRERAAETARARREEQRLRASEERLRIARELHDVVAHNLSLINVQAGTALHLFHEHPEQAEGALSAIKQASKDALDELRSVLDVLRAGDEAAPRVPTPTLADLDTLVERTAAAGIPVELRIDGTRRPLGLPIETAAYRVTQEALTNVARHAGPARTVVHLSYTSDAILVEIDDDGRGPRANGGAGAGKGLTGMRERVQALGGRLDAGAQPGRGFRVRAWIPTGRHS